MEKLTVWTFGSGDSVHLETGGEEFDYRVEAEGEEFLQITAEELEELIGTLYALAFHAGAVSAV